MNTSDPTSDSLFDAIEQRQLMVFDHVSHLSKLNETYITKYLLIALVHSGRLRFEYDKYSVVLNQHDNCVLYPNHIFSVKEASPDYESSVLLIAPSFLTHLRQLHPNHYRPEYHYNVAFHLSDDQFQSLHNCFKLLDTISNIDSVQRDELLTQQMDITATLAETYFRLNHNPFQEMGKKDQLLSHFFDIIAAHFRESREVKFYAEKLCLSPKYFGTIIRESTGISAHEWIARFVASKAQELLRHHPEMSIQEVSRELGFPDQAVFARYFKSITGTSPKEYREI